MSKLDFPLNGSDNTERKILSTTYFPNLSIPSLSDIPHAKLFIGQVLYMFYQMRSIVAH